LPETWEGNPVERDGKINTTSIGANADLRAFMFYIERERYDKLTETLFKLGEAWGLETIADVVYEAVRRADSDGTG
jgi:hypothetical protein